MSILSLKPMQEEKGVVTCLEGQKHGLEDGNVVTFREVEVMGQGSSRGVV